MTKGDVYCLSGILLCYERDIPYYVCCDDNILLNCSYFRISSNLFGYDYTSLLDLFVSVKSHCSKFFCLIIWCFKNFFLWYSRQDVYYHYCCFYLICRMDYLVPWGPCFVYVSLFLSHIRQSDTKLNQKWLSCNAGNSKLSHIWLYYKSCTEGSHTEMPGTVSGQTFPGPWMLYLVNSNFFYCF